LECHHSRQSSGRTSHTFHWCELYGIVPKDALGRKAVLLVRTSSEYRGGDELYRVALPLTTELASGLGTRWDIVDEDRTHSPATISKRSGPT